MPKPFLALSHEADDRLDIYAAIALPSRDPDDEMAIRVLHIRRSGDGLSVVDEYLWGPDGVPADHLMYNPVLTPHHQQPDLWRVVWLERNPYSHEWRLRQATTDWESSSLNGITTIWKGTDNDKPALVTNDDVGLAYKEDFGSPYRFHAIPVSQSGQPLCPD
jgi:hypothetical protein